MNHVVKGLVSKRLASDRRTFKEVCSFFIVHSTCSQLRTTERQQLKKKEKENKKEKQKERIDRTEWENNITVSIMMTGNIALQPGAGVTAKIEPKWTNYIKKK